MRAQGKLLTDGEMTELLELLKDETAVRIPTETLLRGVARYVSEYGDDGIARSPVIDPRIWRENAPKFQAHHADLLIGPWPGAAALYRERSVLQGAAGIRCPVLLVHGDADPVAPVSESLALARVLGDRARLVVLPGEGHTWAFG